MHFINNFLCLFRLLFLASKYQLLTRPGRIYVPLLLRIFGYFITIFLCPIALFRKTTLPIGSRFAEFLKSLGPIYIKFGQTLSTRPDLIGEDVADSLKYLQDRIAPFDFKHVRKRIEESMERKLKDIFAEFNEEPVAAASIAQVHKARLHSGEEVAVKVLRPGIHNKYSDDIKFLEFMAWLTSLFMRTAKRLKPLEIVQVFKHTMHFELDLKSEAAAASTLRDNFQGDKMLYIPRIYWQYTDADILTLEWIDGVSIYDSKKLQDLGHDPDQLAAKIATIFFNMAYRDGFFHADLHPGNILVNKVGNIVLLDFGIMGILPKKDRLTVAEILYALLKRNYYKVAELHHKSGYVPASTDLDQFSQSLRAIAEPIIGLAIKDISIGSLLANLFKVTEKYGMETQPQLIMLQKTIVVVEGIGQSLDPEINMWALAEPWIRKWAVKNLTPEAKILRFLNKVINDLIDEKVS